MSVCVYFCCCCALSVPLLVLHLHLHIDGNPLVLTCLGRGIIQAESHEILAHTMPVFFWNQIKCVHGPHEPNATHVCVCLCVCRNFAIASQFVGTAPWLSNYFDIKTNIYILYNYMREVQASTRSNQFSFFFSTGFCVHTYGQCLRKRQKQ